MNNNSNDFHNKKTSFKDKPTGLNIYNLLPDAIIEESDEKQKPLKNIMYIEKKE